MTFFSLATLMISLAALFTAGDACDNVPKMTWADACLKSCSTPSLFNLCGVTLQKLPDVPKTAEVTVYALTAAAAAKASYEATAAAANELRSRRPPPFPDAEMVAFQHCAESSSAARESMAAVASGLSRCGFQDVVKGYLDAQIAVMSCRQALSGFEGSPLEAMNAADYDATEVAHGLGALMFARDPNVLASSTGSGYHRHS